LAAFSSFGEKFVQKICAKNVDEIDDRRFYFIFGQPVVKFFFET